MFPTLFAMIPKEVREFLLEFIKWVVIFSALALAFWYVDYSAEKRGFDRGVSQTEAKYKGKANEETVKTVVQDRTVKQYMVRKTDADLQRVLDWWMQPDSQGTTDGR